MARQISAAVLVFMLTATCQAHADPATVQLPGVHQKTVAQRQSARFGRNALQFLLPRLPRGSTKQRIFSAIGTFGGLVAGGYIGIKIEGNSCRCDDPGLKGLLIGAPIGAVAGGVVGYKLAR
jgi:hypothetical protein